MKTVTSLAGIGVSLLFASISLGGCATEDYVNKQMAAVQSQVTKQNHQIAGLESNFGAQARHLSRLDSETEALAKLVAGNFNLRRGGNQMVAFEAGSSQLSEPEKANLDELAGRLKSADRNVFAEIEGFADPGGGPDHNDHLGVDRAVAVYNYLRDQGVALNRMDIASHEEQANGETEAARGQVANRVVVISMMQ